MMRLLSIAALALASCHAVPPPQPLVPGLAGSPACPIVGSSDWQAWINAMPGPNAEPTLIVTGKVEVPTGGYRFEWRDLIVMESYPVQIVAGLSPILPTGYVTEAHVTHEVRGEWPMRPPVGAVTIRCGSRTLGTISPVPTAS